MIIYNVTVSINPEIEQEVIKWFKETHIPEVMETSLFRSYQMFKIIEDPTAKIHNSYAIQYELESWDDFAEYTEKHADRLRGDTQKKYGENILAFRTFLEKY